MMIGPKAPESKLLLRLASLSIFNLFLDDGKKSVAAIIISHQISSLLPPTLRPPTSSFFPATII